jgi:hypothetical protein
LAPRIATAIASSHIRIRRHSPKFTTSVIAPIVQKLQRCAAAPNTKASAKASQATSVGRDEGVSMAANYRMACGASTRPLPFGKP